MLEFSKLKQTSNLTFDEIILRVVEKTKETKEKSQNYTIIKQVDDHLERLLEAYKTLSRSSQKNRIATGGVEWFLDNFYIIQEAVELIQEDLPQDYFQKLPEINNQEAVPRITFLAREILAYYEIELVQNDLHEFLDAYQDHISLKMSELWALPLMLRLHLVEILSTIIFELNADTSTRENPKKTSSGLDPNEVVARALRTLLFLNRVDWKSFFETHSQVEKILLKDPIDVYQKMNFDTRDQYRKKIEALAENSAFEENEIAKAAIRLAETPQDTGNKARHIGYYLLGDGKEQLKTKINYQYHISEKINKVFFEHNTAFYLSAIGIITLVVMIGLLNLGGTFTDKPWLMILIGLLSFVPSSSVAVNLVNAVLTSTLSPQILPKMDYKRGVPRRYRTIVVIPALITDHEEITFLLNQLELHYLANKDKNIGFALLTDYSDAPKETMPEDETLLQETIEGIKRLNQRFQGDHGRQAFYLFHRRRQWNPHEDAWIGWERKRGKLGDLNRYLLEGYEKSFDTILGDDSFISDVKFVITVDSDTVLPRDSAKDLIATLAHPLNRPEFDAKSGKITSGYSILQPRTEVKPTSVNRSLFTRVFAGDLGLDLYTRAVSNIYQDLFGEGIYVGKGIYDVEAFHRSLEGKVPDNALLSHDLFEGLQGRAALVSDIVFFEEYPPNYTVHAQRKHRWVRGDWQLLPWLFTKVPIRSGETGPNPFSTIDLWKIFDNLRRSLLPAATMALLVSGWLFFHRNAWLWTLVILVLSAFPLVNNIVLTLSSRLILGSQTNIANNIKSSVLRWAFSVIFLPYETIIMLDAVLTTLIRVFISRKRLLQWQTASHTIKLFGRQRKIGIIWQRMISAPLLSLVIAFLTYFLNRCCFSACLFLAVLWFFSPQIAFWISMEQDRKEKDQLNDAELQKFRSIARKTWFYFERFIGPADHWLPPDHFQEDPKGLVAHRTSPTNIGLMLLSTCSAFDLGYIALLDFVYRISYTFETLDDLEKYRGHLLNWYDTETRETLSPRYVSTVDSGNFAMSLIGLYQSLLELPEQKICYTRLFEGAIDGIDVFCEVLKSIKNDSLQDTVNSLYEHCRMIQSDIKEKELTDSRQLGLLMSFEERLTEPMNILLKNILRMEDVIDADQLRDLRYWSNVNFQHLINMRSQINLLLPWVQTWQNRPVSVDNIQNPEWRNIFEILINERALQISLAEIPEFCEVALNSLGAFVPVDGTDVFTDLTSAQKQALSKWIESFKADLQTSKENAEDALSQINALLDKIQFHLERMEFDFLFDKNREVFYLGYQVGAGRLDQNHYDLMASEARTASLYAIAQNEVPRSHWLHLSRPFTSIDGYPTLLSWNGSMFEYLMPNLFTKIYPETLLQQTSKGVVSAQINYAKKKNVPWGISESSYYRFDQSDNYQYQGFGVPSLGRKRGLANDLVITPYASLMAVEICPRDVLANIDHLEAQGAMGHFGFYESIDYTETRLPVGEDKAIIKSYMAHHQGMIMVALGNFLGNSSIVDRVHNDPRIKSTELLLQEQIPQIKPVQKTEKLQTAARSQESTRTMVVPWKVPADRPGKFVHVISNGDLRMFITDSGSGYLEWKATALTRWRKDAALDTWGLWYFIQDLENGKYWSIGRQPKGSHAQDYQVIFSPHMFEIRQITAGIRSVLQTTITPKDDICVQRLSITSQSDQARRIKLLSYGEVVLAPQAADQQHPAFNKMFIESLFDDEHHMIYFQRRKRASKEKPRGMAHLVIDEHSKNNLEYETDRKNFIGRGHDITNPIALESQLSLSNRTGITLDPIFSLGKSISLDSNQTIDINYLTLPAENLAQARSLAASYHNPIKISNAFSASESSSEKLLRAIELDSAHLSEYQKLLSHVIYPSPGLRPAPSVLEENSLSQSGLWSFGISGDYPIILLMIDHAADLEALQEGLLAHSYWRKLGLMIDLVILNTKDVGYTHELNEKIHQTINKMDAGDWVNRRGGIFVLTEKQMERNSVILLKTAAKTVLDLQKDDLKGHLVKAADIAPSLPPFVPTGDDQQFIVDHRIQRPDNLVLDNGIGGFSDDGREYCIFLENYPTLTKGIGQHTPAPWINVIANQNFGFLITETGGGFTWSENSGENRLTPWTNDPVSDPSGEALYIRDEITGSVWTPTPNPAGEGTDYLVTHGQGYTTFKSIRHGFEQEVKAFVDAQQPIKFVQLTLTNLSSEERRMTATYYVDWVLSSSRQESQNFILPSFDSESEALLARNTYSAEFSEKVAFLVSDQPVHGVTTDRQEFLGIPGSLSEPEGLKRLGLSGNVEAGTDPCAVLQIHLNFNPGEKKEVTFLIGQGDNYQDALQLARNATQESAIEESWKNSQEKWASLLNWLQVSTPEPTLNIILNRWLLYQALSCRIWGRSAFYQSSGAYGFRDQLQDVTAVLTANPEEAREHILRAARHQFDEGDVLHWWHPPSGRGVRTRITDDLLWLVYVTAEYIEKTGDFAILDEEIPFKMGDPLKEDQEERYGHYENSKEEYSLFEHCRRALDHGDNRGPHGLPLIGTGDWNDGMNRVGIGGKGESVWLAWFLVENHNRFAQLCERRDEFELARQHRQRAEEIKKAVNQVAWDDHWYLRAYYDDGSPLGSHRNEECQIDSLPQSWAILTGGAPSERQKQAIQAVEDHLVQKQDQLIQLFTPPFDKTEKDPGYIKGYPPGIRENGGQYTHAAIWAVWALTKLGKGNKAFEQFQFLNPVTHSLNLDDANRYAVEPYVVAADIYSRPPFVGHGGWTWYTGSSGWLYRLGVEAILGFNLVGDHFTMDPCIPETWDGFHVRYESNQTIYNIEVSNPDHVEKGVREIRLDGEPVQNNKVRMLKDQSDHQVLVIMGEN